MLVRAAASQEDVDERDARGEYVLAVIDNAPRGLVGQGFAHGLGERAHELFAQAERGRDALDDQVRIDQRRQVSEVHLRRIPRRYLQREASLADPTAAGQGQQSNRVQPRSDVGDSFFAADETAQRHIQRRRTTPPTQAALRCLLGEDRSRKTAVELLQRSRQPTHRLGVRHASRSALQVLDAANAEPGQFGQLFLGHPGRQALAAQRRPEQYWLACHTAPKPAVHGKRWQRCGSIRI
jgi:hypothetical protein